jgi:hypothetical protein
VKWILIIAGLLVTGLVLRIALAPLWFANRAVTVASQEIDPRQLQNRYEWFKDAAAALDQKRASLTLYEQRFEDLQVQYGTAKRTEWARDDREQWSIWRSEAAGIAASYNDLAGQYNAQMAKWNWRFTNRGMLPQGATEPLPREFKPYLEAQ